MAEAKDYYKIMGVSRDASEKDIKMAYRRLARKYHPDLNKEPQAEEKFKELGEAYEVLKDPKKRADFDKFGSAGPGFADQGGRQYHSTQPGANPFGFSMDEDFLSSLFGQYAKRGQQAMKGEDYQTNITLSLEEAYRGTTRDIIIPVQDSTTGKTQSETKRVKIPPGVREAQKIRLVGQGGPGFNKGPRGDLYLTVHFHKHPLYAIKGGDLYLSLPITPWEAALGATVKVPTLGGPVDLKVPIGSQTGQQLRLKDRGLPGKIVGSQFIELKILTPLAQSEAEKKCYQTMAELMPFNPRSHLGV